MKTKLVDLACPFALGNLIWARLPKCKEFDLLSPISNSATLSSTQRTDIYPSSTETGADSADGRAANMRCS